MADAGWTEVGKEEAEKEPEYFIVSFKELGQQFVGKLLEIREGIKGKFGEETHYVFATRGKDGKPVKAAINPNADLQKRFGAKPLIGSMVRITYVQDKDIGKQSPMKQFKVEVAAAAAAPATAPAPTGAAGF